MNSKQTPVKPPVKRRPLSPCQTLPQIHERLRTGAKTIVIDHHNDKPLELTDAELPDGITIRIIGTSRVTITRLTPQTKNSTQIVATDATQVRIFGHATLFAYGHTHIDAFDTTRVRATNRAVISLVDHTYAEAGEDTTIYAYDHATVHTHDHAAIHATDHVTLIHHSSTTAEVEHGVAVFGPSRNNIRLRTREPGH
ncbi:hypothetical protein R3Q06_28945 [Rhodococcus erythropolis]|uniref:hypothetical protein n=1 Tax=Rhodococcus erythropolis TaxID=1833 RepID=UPI00294A723D|nr:hypothetical protein [Rhodococcus erythropolis]MDV6277524.1 hypothetical protein [Rhodococcus erythropolis]